MISSNDITIFRGQNCVHLPVSYSKNYTKFQYTLMHRNISVLFNVPAWLASTWKVVSLFTMAVLRPMPLEMTLEASDLAVGTAENFCVVDVLVTVSTTTWDCSVHPPCGALPAPAKQLTLLRI